MHWSPVTRVVGGGVTAGVGSETRVLGQSHEPFMVPGISQTGGRKKGRCLSDPRSGASVFYSLLFYCVVPKRNAREFSLRPLRERYNIVSGYRYL